MMSGYDPVGKSDSADSEEGPKPVSVIKLFRHATGREKFLIIIGILTAAIAGLGMPITIILFGNLTNNFVNKAVADGMLNTSITTTSTPNTTIVYEPTTLVTTLSSSITSFTELTNSTETSAEDVEYRRQLELQDVMMHFSDKMNKFGFRMLIVASLQLSFSYVMVAALNTAAEKQVLRIKVLFLKGVLRQDMSWFDTHKAGDFATTSVENLNKIEEGIGEKIGMVVYFLSNCFSSIIVAFCYGWKLTLVIMSVTPVLAVSTAVFAKLQTSLTSDETKAYSKAGVVAEESLSAIRTVVAFGGEERTLEKYKKNLTHAQATGLKRALISGSGQAVAWFMIFGSYALAFWYGVLLISESTKAKTYEYDPGVLLIVFFSAIMGAMNIGQASPYIEALSVARGAASTVYDIIDKEPLIDSSSLQGEILKSLERHIIFKDLHFTYPSRPEVPILNGLNLTINKGETVALVGSSGCGKSTVVQLLQRFYDPDKGSISVDDHDIKDLNLRSLRDNIGVVSQEPVLFGLTIGENIRLGKDGVTQEEVEKASKAANAHDFVTKLPKQYDTLVGERGAQLSGGQKQRIALARALVRDPSILLLDEATSALDTQSEAIVQAALDEAGSGRTTIVIAHRLTTVRNADKIVAIDKGQVVETGTHDELMEAKGIYYHLVVSQSETSTEKNGDDKNGSEDELDEASSVPFALQRFNSVNTPTPDHVPNPRTMSAVSATGLKTTKNEFKPALSKVIKANSKEWPQILIGCIAALAFGCNTPCYAFLFGEIMGILALQPDEATKKSVIYACLFLAVGVWAGVSCFVQIYMFAIAGERLTKRLREITFKAILRQEISWFDAPENGTGALCTRLATDASNVQGATGSRIGVVLQTFGSLGIALILALVLVWKQALVSIAVIPVVFISVYFQTKLLSGQTVKDMDEEEKAGKIAVEAISNHKTVASLCKEDTFCTMYEDGIKKLKGKSVKRNHLRGFLFGFSQSVPMVCYALSLWYGGRLIEHEGVPYKDVFKVAELLIFGTMMVGQTIAFAPNYNKGLISAGRIFVLLERKPEIDVYSDEGLTIPTTAGTTLEFHDTTFHYPTRKQVRVLKDLSLKIEDGQRVALVGSSGCGKSTCIQLLERFYDPSKGSLSFASENIKNLNVRWLRSQMGLVSQEPTLFDCSIEENIAYGDTNRNVTMDEIIEAAKKANIHSFIKELPQGYETNVGNKGTQLSGGQKQRIAIARALVRNPKILLLDEATSALDTESEKLVQEALEKAMVGRTSIIIAHRLTTIQDVDQIFVFHHGKIVEIGTHQQLLSQKGYYYHLHSAQVN